MKTIRHLAFFVLITVFSSGCTCAIRSRWGLGDGCGKSGDFNRKERIDRKVIVNTETRKLESGTSAASPLSGGINDSCISSSALFAFSAVN